MSRSAAPGAGPFSGLDAELADLARTARDSGAPPMIELGPGPVRERVSAGDRLCASGPAVTTGQATIAGIPVQIYEGPRTRATLVYAHGGGWVSGNATYSDELCRFLAVDAGIRIVSVDYRLAPEHPLPAGADDVVTVLRSCRDAWPGPIGTGGDSAGGHLAAAAVRSGRTDFLVLIYPVLDRPGRWPSYSRMARAFPIGSADMAWFWQQAGGAELPAGEMPLEGPDAGDIPPTVLMLAGHDPLHDEGIAFADRARAAGSWITVTDNPELCHGFLRFTAVSAAARAARSELVQQVSRLVDRTISSKGCRGM